MSRAVIVDIVRTASGKGKAGGALSDLHPADLLAETLSALVSRTGIDPGGVDDVIAGCVTQVGDQGLNIARTALLTAGFPVEVPGTTIDRQCGSSQQAMHFAAHAVEAGAYDVAIACGVESMSRAPMFSNRAGGDPFAPLAARFPGGLPAQGYGAESIAARWGLRREQLDEFAATSHARAAATAAAGGFDAEIIPIAAGGTVHRADETVRTGTTAGRLGGLSPAFVDDEIGARFPEIDWRITPGNSSPLTDGAAAALIMSEERAARLGLTPRAAFRSYAVTGSDPVLMLTGVIPATRKALERISMPLDDVDVFEVSEAFAPVPLAWAADLGVDLDRVNPRGGAIALGHPLGASGVRIMATMLNHLEQTGGTIGLQTMCEGGGMANATVIERL